MPKWTKWLDDDPEDEAPIDNFKPIRKNKQIERDDIPQNIQRVKKRTNTEKTD